MALRSPQLTGRFSKALTFARKAHAGQVRKGSKVPYLSHPMAVASIVLDYGGSEDEAIAALLHDTIEDCGATHEGLKKRFGAKVAGIVRDCSDSFTTPKPPWLERKTLYIGHLEGGHGRAALLVSAADKLHNARAIVHDVRHFGKKVWRKFNARPQAILWYYESLLKVFKRRRREAPAGFSTLVLELETAVDALRRLA
ncbi:MAG: HD domain-containing protein [Elusimicrobia bacterium]|nr:HD domain-containing protein [Elusimicrobiota bacterium]